MSQQIVKKSAVAQQKLSALIQNQRVSKRPRPKKMDRYGIKNKTSSESEAKKKDAIQHVTSIPPPKIPNSKNNPV